MIELPHIAKQLSGQCSVDVSMPLDYCHIEAWFDDHAKSLQLWIYHPDWFWDCFETQSISYWKEEVRRLATSCGIKIINYCPAKEAIEQITVARQWTLEDLRCVALLRVASSSKKVLRICSR
jgi:hypothetical protein